MSRPPAVTITGVGVTLGGATILSDVSLTVEPGEFLALIGPNGAGKSTLIRSIVGLNRPTGTVSIGGSQDRARSVAYVAQDPVLPVGMTVAEYVLLGRTAHLSWLAVESAADRRRVADALDRLELGDFAGRTLDQLSGGEAQRVSLARALVSEAPILVLDEPTSALDLGHQMSVMEMIEELRVERSLTVITALHDLTAASRFADRIALMARGRLVEVGPPAEVLTEPILSLHYDAPIGIIPADDGTIIVLPLPTTSAKASQHG